MNTFFKKSWVTMFVNGIIAAVVGLILLFVKGDAVQLLIKWTGIILIIVAATLIGVDIFAAIKKRYWGSLTFISVFILVAGIICAFMPESVRNFLLVAIGVWAILTGVFQIITTIKFRKHVPQNALSIVNGVLMVVLGVIFVFNPEIMAKAMTFIVGAFLVISGLWEIFNAFRFKKIAKNIERDKLAD